MDYKVAPVEFEGRLTNGKDWREIVAWIGDIPPMPFVAAKVLRMAQNPDINSKMLSEVLESDLALAAKVLKIANSAMFARQREITTIMQAITIIGLKSLVGIVVACAVQNKDKSSSKLQELIWENSIFVAMCSLNIAKYLKIQNADEVFLLGLLHNLGQVVMLSSSDLLKDYKNVINNIKDNNLDYTTSEQQILGYAHPLIGALVAKKWNFPGETCQIILHYADPCESFSPDNAQDKKAMIVQLADIIAHLSGVGSPEGYFIDNKKVATLLKKLNIPENEQLTIMQDITEKSLKSFEEEKSLYM